MVRKLRIIQKLSVQKFAEQVGLTRQYVYGLESGKFAPSTKTIESIANAFDVPITFFYDESYSHENTNMESKQP